ncbi:MULTISPECIES: MCE family protein [unclassified Gordonia (in: high G+C Gram-positive bacteria)]|uniref:MCE family protein n=1 Tax=unclassified Gordonia (in: high G+C Gram-positive bacteria) TaxID=2657482 RepID=UPI0009AEBFDE|nr:MULTISPECIES: MCE family protein [unclassified Gordonia (in: high G+C Gram-positive bacteria)]MDF3284152.1 MCE family protein [Gordonia sp. N1V]OPX16593.1 mammalian cell entry protein [Gordonia sp. i37]
MAVLFSVTGCTFDGVNSFSLPGNTSGGDTYRVTVDLADAQNLVGNSPVKAGNVTVGNIRKVETNGWQARLLLDINSDQQIAGNVRATLAQTSLFGSQYIELAVPAGAAPTGHLSAGANIPVSDTSQYPPVEKVLSSLSLVLNGSGLQQLRTITDQTNQILDGHEDDARALVGRLDTFVTNIEAQRGDIENAIESLASLSTTLSEQVSTISHGIDTIGPAINVLNAQERNLVSMLDSIGSFGDAATGVLNRSRDSVVDEVSNLAPTLNSLADAGNALPEALKVALTLPFPVTTIDRTAKGDYVNLFLTLDISPQKLANVVLPSVTRLPRDEPPLSREAVDPLRAPTQRSGGQ